MSGVELLVVGAPRAAGAEVAELLAALPPGLRVPVVLVLHRGPVDVLDAPLARQCVLPLVEPDDKDALVPGHVYLAPAGYHLLVDRGCICLSREPPEHQQRPAIDPLLESAADSYGASVAALLFSGHEDGRAGLALLRQRGALVRLVGRGHEASEPERLSLEAVGPWLEQLGCAPRARVAP